MFNPVTTVSSAVVTSNSEPVSSNDVKINIAENPSQDASQVLSCWNAGKFPDSAAELADHLQKIAALAPEVLESVAICPETILDKLAYSRETRVNKARAWSWLGKIAATGGFVGGIYEATLQPDTAMGVLILVIVALAALAFHKLGKCLSTREATAREDSRQFFATKLGPELRGRFQRCAHGLIYEYDEACKREGVAVDANVLAVGTLKPDETRLLLTKVERTRSRLEIVTQCREILGDHDAMSNVYKLVMKAHLYDLKLDEDLHNITTSDCCVSRCCSSCCVKNPIETEIENSVINNIENSKRTEIVSYYSSVRSACRNILNHYDLASPARVVLPSADSQASDSTGSAGSSSVPTQARRPSGLLLSGRHPSPMLRPSTPIAGLSPKDDRKGSIPDALPTNLTASAFVASLDKPVASFGELVKRSGIREKRTNSSADSDSSSSDSPSSQVSRSWRRSEGPIRGLPIIRTATDSPPKTASDSPTKSSETLPLRRLPTAAQVTSPQGSPPKRFITLSGQPPVLSLNAPVSLNDLSLNLQSPARVPTQQSAVIQPRGRPQPIATTRPTETTWTLSTPIIPNAAKPKPGRVKHRVAPIKQ